MLMLTQHTAFRGAKTIPTRTGELNCKLRKGDTKHFSKNQQRNNSRRIHTRTHTLYIRRESVPMKRKELDLATRDRNALFLMNYIIIYIRIFMLVPQ